MTMNTLSHRRHDISDHIWNFSLEALASNKLQHPGSQSHVSFWLEQYSALIATDGGQNEDF
ncbi:hypothetical protein XBI1_1870064 [Xenorhabdus bovienii str. Intermedium]|uniref:Uncharacterized protein n=1 Tax=Xenorhabdus bovienii str. Intermedium TaxID=1379677 RepID=A0A077QG33_XENBV|nr:hypothetical protein XBI1_1870064 [Xenorhabdus bovienii str. Intermedium]